MNKKIKKIGGIQKLDSNGFIINDFNVKNLQVEYQCILNDVLILCKENFEDLMHSIYLRGSVLKGKAIKEISDIDIIILSNRIPTEEENNKSKNIRIEVNNKYDYLNGVELFFLSIDEIEKSKKFQFLLKTQSKCIFGKDLRFTLPDFGIGKHSYAHSKHLIKNIEKVKIRFAKEENKSKIKNTCTWIMKRIVRVGFEIVMKKEQFFTRDLYYCYESFSKYHKSKSNEMYSALEMAVFPIDDKDKILSTIHSLEKYLIDEIELLDFIHM